MTCHVMANMLASYCVCVYVCAGMCVCACMLKQKRFQFVIAGYENETNSLNTSIIDQCLLWGRMPQLAKKSRHLKYYSR